MQRLGDLYGLKFIVSYPSEVITHYQFIPPFYLENQINTQLNEQQYIPSGLISIPSFGLIADCTYYLII